MLHRPRALRAGVIAGLVVMSVTAGATAVSAAGKNGGDNDEGGPQFSTNATLTSDYRFRGFSQTREKSALQGGLDATWRQFYVGAWATNVDFGRVMDPQRRWHDAASVEVDTYVGMKHKFSGIETDLGFIYYAYPGAYGLPQRLDYIEVKAGISGEVRPSLTADLQVYYSPDYQGETGRNWVFEGGLAQKLGAHGPLTPSLSARLGYSAGDEAKGGIDYWFWNAGVTLGFAQYFEFDLRYFDTFDVPGSVSCHDRCNGRVVARITFEN